MRLSEVASNKQVVVVYPGRFQPFHKGHKAVYDHLSSKYDDVYIATSDKVDPPRSPFNFEEKKKMMELTGMDTSKVVLTRAPYVATEITRNFDPKNTILLFAVSEKDMAEDPRFTFGPKKDGSPSYFQDAKEGNFETMDKHGYMITVPTFDFNVLGKPMKSATEVRAQFAAADGGTKKQIIQDLFGNFSVDVFNLMNSKITESLAEGGWTDVATQQTKLTPSIVKAGLNAVAHFLKGYNQWLQANGHGPVVQGAPTGSSAYHDVDDDDMEYGDIDLQMEVEEMPGLTANQVSDVYNKLTDKYIEETQPAEIYMPGQPAHGHPIFKIGEDHVQIDFMWATNDIRDWARWRKTPQRGVKGLISGNMFSALGEVLNMSIQGAGVQMKTIDGKPAKFMQRKNTELHTLSTRIDKFGIDILKAFYQGEHGNVDGIKIDPELEQYPGLNRDEVKVTDLAHTVKGLAKSFALNDLYGKWGLENYSSAEELTDAFVTQHLKKADLAIKSSKFDKAEGPEGKAKAEKVKAYIAAGADIVRKAFSESAHKKLKGNKRMSAQKLGIFAKGRNKVSLWEHDGKIVLVDSNTKRLQETKGSVKQAVNLLYDKGYVCESLETSFMKNAAGLVMQLVTDTISGATKIQDQQGGTTKYGSLPQALKTASRAGYKATTQPQAGKKGAWDQNQGVAGAGHNDGGLSLVDKEPNQRGGSKMGKPMGGLIEDELSDKYRQSKDNPYGTEGNGYDDGRLDREDDEFQRGWDDDKEEKLHTEDDLFASRQTPRYGYEKRKLKY